MSRQSIGLDERVHDYLVEVGVREHPVLAWLREQTAPMPNAQMQIGPDQGALMALLVKLTGARRIVEIGTFTGYSSTAMALALPPDGRIVCLDVNDEWTDVARRAWADAGVAEKAELRIGPALETLDQMLSDGQEGSFDMAFIDADKEGYDGYYEACLRLVRAGGLILLDNMLASGRVADPDEQDPRTVAIRDLNAKIAADERVEVALTPVGDGLSMVRVR